MTIAVNAPTIIDAIGDPHLFRPYFADANDSIATWRNWATALRVLYGLPIHPGSYDLIRQCTGRDPTKLPSEGFDTALIMPGRRAGKSKTISAVGAHASVLSGLERRLSKGEQGVVATVAPTKRQSKIVHSYMRAIFDTPLLAREVVEETKDMGFELRNGVRIEQLCGDYRSVRGFTLLLCIIDEIAMMGLSEESKVRSDTELVNSIKPALATTGGKLIAITTPYAKRGWTYTTYKKNFGNDNGKVLVWNCPSTVMNPTLPQSVVDAALAEDYAVACAEYLGQFRDDVGLFLPREVIEALVIRGRKELLPMPGRTYSAFCDMSGGRGDSAALAIAHQDGRECILDLLRAYHPPFSPAAVCRLMAGELQRYGIRRITGDNYAAEYTDAAFAECGIGYMKATKTASSLYAELLPRLMAKEIQLLDDDLLVNQLAALERRTRSGGKDQISHPPGVGCHDDIANAVAGVACAAPSRRVGSMF